MNYYDVQCYDVLYYTITYHHINHNMITVFRRETSMLMSMSTQEKATRTWGGAGDARNPDATSRERRWVVALCISEHTYT